jgi:hypothetical protein
MMRAIGAPKAGVRDRQQWGRKPSVNIDAVSGNSRPKTAINCIN